MSDHQRTEEVRKTSALYAHSGKVFLQKEDPKLAGEVKVQRHVGHLEKRGVSAEELPAAARRFRREKLGVRIASSKTGWRPLLPETSHGTAHLGAPTITMCAGVPSIG